MGEKTIRSQIAEAEKDEARKTRQIKDEVVEELEEEKREFAKSRIRRRMILLQEAKEQLRKEQDWYDKLLAMSIDEICEKEHYIAEGGAFFIKGE